MGTTDYYGRFLEKRREEKGIERDVLGKGIFYSNSIGKVEKGKRYTDKLNRNRLLGRLGESGYDYECFLQVEEYKNWEERCKIIDSLDNLELDRAEQLLKRYEKNALMKEKVVKQFYLIMQVQRMELKGESREKCLQMLEEAIKLTIPDIDTMKVRELKFSMQELNLILEYYAYKCPERLLELCTELLQYIEQNSLDLESRAMLCAKIALYYCDGSSVNKGQTASLQQKLKICSDGIEALRNHQKIYFAWELLQKKEQYIKDILKCGMVFSTKQVEEYKEELKQAKEFYWLIDSLYEKFQIPKKTNSFTCFYREHEIYCMNDVIRARRRMFRISRAELQRMFLGKSTIKRLEKNETNLHIENARNLFQYFKLSTEMLRAQIITDSQEAIWVEKEFRWEMKQRNYEKAERLLHELRERIPLTESINWQYVFYWEKRLEYSMKKISKEEFVQFSKEALEVTLPLSIALTRMKEEKTSNGKIWLKEKYCTNMEVTILFNIALEYGNDGPNEYWEVLKEYFEWLEQKNTLAPIIGMYGFVMTTVASWMGNLGLYEESSNINRKIIREVLRTRNFSYIRRNMYGLLWNEWKQKGLPMEKEDPRWRKGLLDCLTVDIYCKDEWQEKNMRKRLGL